MAKLNKELRYGEKVSLDIYRVLAMKFFHDFATPINAVSLLLELQESSDEDSSSKKKTSTGKFEPAEFMKFLGHTVQKMKAEFLLYRFLFMDEQADSWEDLKTAIDDECVVRKIKTNILEIQDYSVKGIIRTLSCLFLLYNDSFEKEMDAFMINEATLHKFVLKIRVSAKSKRKKDFVPEDGEGISVYNVLEEFLRFFLYKYEISYAFKESQGEFVLTLSQKSMTNRL
ncbi:hypothetical protein AGMMS49949_07230 [Alphaproteobacteria bacterium]|nr:hypothetical protein AGMMS49949_07230 [Alphaproteobacteria bacterium]GHS99600.1 hypothetical protein AGMMS50296_7810 [Alphaproteobacteria bacterium]